MSFESKVAFHGAPVYLNILPSVTCVYGCNRCYIISKKPSRFMFYKSSDARFLFEIGCDLPAILTFHTFGSKACGYGN